MWSAAETLLFKLCCHEDWDHNPGPVDGCFRFGWRLRRSPALRKVEAPSYLAGSSREQSVPCRIRIFPRTKGTVDEKPR